MPTRKLVQIEAWSFSRYKDYTTCPALAKFKHLDRLEEPHGLAMGRGGDIHTLAEQYVLSGGAMPEELTRFADEFKNLRRYKKDCVVEQEWCFDKNWEQCDWKDWARAWLRIKVDLFHARKTKGEVIDYKTGKIRDENKLQLELYAIGAFLIYPKITVVDTQLWYLDQGELINQVFERDQLYALQQKWLNMTRAMLTDTAFAPSPNPHCRYCHFRKSNQGPCEVG
jgi:CRISPR/Cas system-associated exonuclease Cas4 (RecB family)